VRTTSHKSKKHSHQWSTQRGQKPGSSPSCSESTIAKPSIGRSASKTEGIASAKPAGKTLNFKEKAQRPIFPATITESKTIRKESRQKRRVRETARTAEMRRRRQHGAEEAPEEKRLSRKTGKGSRLKKEKNKNKLPV